MATTAETYRPTCRDCGHDHPAGPTCPARPEHVDHRGPGDCPACDLEILETEEPGAGEEELWCGECGEPVDDDDTLPRPHGEILHETCNTDHVNRCPDCR